MTEQTDIFAARGEQVPQLCQFVLAGAKKAGLSEKDRTHIELACDEAATNIIEHAYRHMGGDIVVTWTIKPKTFDIVLMNKGKSFEPDLIPAVSPLYENMPIETVSIGGWGMHFMQTFMDEVSYEFSEKCNKVILVKNIPEQHDKRVWTRPFNEQYHQIDVVGLVGRLDQTTIPMLEEQLQLLATQERYRVILDMSQITYTNSGGLRIIVASWRNNRQHNGDLVLVGLSSQLQEIFDMVGFDKILNIVDSLEEARLLLC